jgi:predicted component of type VI protein secretion system
MPSDLIPLHDGMIISFVNYELRVRFEEKTSDEVLQQTQAQAAFFAKQDAEITAKATATAVPVPQKPAKAEPSDVAVAVPIHAGGDGYVAEQV